MFLSMSSACLLSFLSNLGYSSNEKLDSKRFQLTLNTTAAFPTLARHLYPVYSTFSCSTFQTTTQTRRLDSMRSIKVGQIAQLKKGMFHKSQLDNC